jgi:hypothetical protein
VAGAQGATGPSYGTPAPSALGKGFAGFNTTPDDTIGITAYGWIVINIGGIDYYVPAWT